VRNSKKGGTFGWELTRGLSFMTVGVFQLLYATTQLSSITNLPFAHITHTVKVYWSSDSTSPICCGFVVQQVLQNNPQQIHNSSTNPQHLNMSRCCVFVVDSTTNPQQIEAMQHGFRIVHNKPKRCTTNPQLYDKVVQLVVQQVHNKSNKWSFSSSHVAAREYTRLKISLALYETPLQRIDDALN
jgi:hypothetical protein